MKLMLVSADTSTILEAQKAGVDRIFFDLEYINKAERQAGRNTLISHNKIEDIPKLRKIIDKAEFLVRVNPINPNSHFEINYAIDNGADIIMLPMVIDADDVRALVEYVGGRAQVMPMIETAQAMTRIDDILEIDGIDEIYIGLNDLHISLGLDFMFETLSGGIVEYLAKKITEKGIKFGFGGIAKIGEGVLPAEAILAEHYRLGSNSVILSRTFRNEVGSNDQKIDLIKEIKKIREEEDKIKLWTEKDFEANRLFVKAKVQEIVNTINGR